MTQKKYLKKGDSMKKYSDRLSTKLRQVPLYGNLDLLNEIILVIFRLLLMRLLIFINLNSLQNGGRKKHQLLLWLRGNGSRNKTSYNQPLKKLLKKLPKKLLTKPQMTVHQPIKLGLLALLHRFSN